MKKGCFLSILIILTIIIAVVIYLFKYRLNDIADVVKPVIINSASEDFREKVKLIENNANKDSLLRIVDDFSAKVKNGDYINMNRLHDFFDEAKHFIHDGKIDSLELQNLHRLLKEY